VPETNKKCQETYKKCQETYKKCQETYKKCQETNKKCQETNKKCQETNNLYYVQVKNLLKLVTNEHVIKFNMLLSVECSIF